MQRNKFEMFLFVLVITFILFSRQLDPLITLLITGIILALLFFYRSRSEKRAAEKAVKDSLKKTSKPKSSLPKNKHQTISK